MLISTISENGEDLNLDNEVEEFEIPVTSPPKDNQLGKFQE